MQKRTISTAVEAPITADEFRQWARIDNEDDEALIETLLLFATQQAEAITGKVIGEHEIEYTFDLSEADSKQTFSVPVAPAAEIEVAIRTDDGVMTPLTTDDYNFTTHDIGLNVRVKTLATLPSCVSIVITVTAGYPDSESLPATIRQAITVIAAAHFADREGGDAVTRAMATANALLANHRVQVL